MKSEELRIGNWVRHYSEWSYRMPDNGPFEEFDFQWEERDWYGTSESCLELDKIKPIMLTEKWLYILGFEKDIITFRKHPLAININQQSGIVNNIWIGSTSIPQLTIQYVHQLQNLYFCLTGQELTLAPPQR